MELAATTTTPRPSVGVTASGRRSPASAMAFQRKGIRWMLNRELNAGEDGPRGGLLCDDVGLGKSIQMLGTMARNPMNWNLIVVFRSLLTQWENYVEMWLPCHTLVVLARGNTFKAAMRSMHASVKVGRPAILLTTYGTVSERVGSSVDKSEIRRLWDRVILDECHAIKNDKTQRFKCAMKIPARIRWGLTATPLQNTLEEVQSLMSWLRAFEKNASSDAGKPMKPEEEVARFRRKCVLSRKRTDVAQELPTKLEEPVVITVVRPFDNEVEAAGYEELRAIMAAEISRIMHTDVVKLNAAAKMAKMTGCLVRLMQYTAQPSMACTPALCAQSPYIRAASSLTMSTKTRSLVDALRQSRPHRSVVFCKFIEEMYAVQRAVEAVGMSTATLHGSSSEPVRAAVLQSAWLHYGVIQRVCSLPPGLPNEITYKIFGMCCPEVLVAQIDCTGVGLNFTGFTRCYFHTLCWNPCQEMQAIGRLNRIGQRHRVTAVRLETQTNDMFAEYIDARKRKQEDGHGGADEEEEGERNDGPSPKSAYDPHSTIDTRILQRQDEKRQLIGWWGGPCPAVGRRKMSMSLHDMKRLLS